MKKKSLALFLALSLVFLCAIGGTMAWLSATSDQIVNTFTDSDISITLTETTGNEYKMIPGYTISKDPKVTVKAGSEKCYLFIKLEESDNFDSFLSYETADGWTALDGTDNVYYRIVDSADEDTSYGILKNDQVTVLDTVTKELMNGLTEETEPTLSFTAYASQFNKNAGESFTVSEAWQNISTSND